MLPHSVFDAAEDIEVKVSKKKEAVVEHTGRTLSGVDDTEVLDLQNCRLTFVTGSDHTSAY
jgi:hypothetical protein